MIEIDGQEGDIIVSLLAREVRRLRAELEDSRHEAERARDTHFSLCEERDRYRRETTDQHYEIERLQRLLDAANLRAAKLEGLVDPKDLASLKPRPDAVEIDLLRAGNWIGCIKHVRARHLPLLGLKDAKDMVDAWRADTSLYAGSTQEIEDSIVRAKNVFV